MIATRRLTDEEVEELRSRFPYAPDRSWVGKLAKKCGWQQANTIYLEGERKRSAAGIRHLMSELGVRRVRSAGEALDLIELAIEVFAPDDGFGGMVTRHSDGALGVEATNSLVAEKKWGDPACVAKIVVTRVN